MKNVKNYRIIQYFFFILCCIILWTSNVSSVQAADKLVSNLLKLQDCENKAIKQSTVIRDAEKKVIAAQKSFESVKKVVQTEPLKDEGLSDYLSRLTKKKRADYNYQEVKQDVVNKKLMLTNQVRSIYLQLVLSTKQIKQMDSMILTLKKNISQLQIKLEFGLTTTKNIDQVDTQLQKIVNQRLQIQHQADQSQTKLFKIIGLTANNTYEYVDPKMYISMQSSDVTSLLQQALKSNPSYLILYNQSQITQQKLSIIQHLIDKKNGIYSLKVLQSTQKELQSSLKKVLLELEGIQKAMTKNIQQAFVLYQDSNNNVLKAIKQKTKATENLLTAQLEYQFKLISNQEWKVKQNIEKTAQNTLELSQLNEEFSVIQLQLVTFGAVDSLQSHGGTSR